MKWNIKVIYQILYTFMTMLCIGGLMYSAFFSGEEQIKDLQVFALWGELSLIEQFGWLLIGLVIVALIFVVIYLCNGFRLMKLLIALASGGYIGYCFVQEQTVANVIVIITLLMILQALLEYLVKDAIYTLPLFLLFGLLLILFPVKEEPLQWKFVKEIYNTIRVIATEISAKLDYYRNEEDSMAAFSQTPSFGGSITDNEMEQLCLVGDGKETGMYLSGKIYNIYTEDGWYNEITPEIYNDNGWNYVQLLTFLKGAEVEKEQVRSLCKRRTYTVMYKTIYTETAFTFLHTITYDAGNEMYEYRNGSAVFDKPKDNGFQYDITYIDINYGSEILQNMWKQIDVAEFSAYSYEELQQYSMEYFNIDLEKVISEEEYLYSEYKWADVVAENYLEVPEYVPQRVHMLAEEITKDCNSDFEKISAIAEYLHSFDYSKDPMELEGDCVIDSFLFDSKEGYCTHFASAMVLLSRSVGIPARYVSGFYLREKNKSESDTYHAKGNDAHAWAECYLEGYGFLPVEATPGYYSSTMQQWSQNEMDSKVVNTVLEQQELEENAEEIEQEKNAKKRTILAIAGIVVLVLLILCLITIIWFFVCYRLYKLMEVTKQCWILWYLQFKILTKTELRMLQGETLREYGKRIQVVEISDCITIYESIKYGQMACGIEEKEMFYKCLQYCKSQIRGGDIWLLWYFLTSIPRMNKSFNSGKNYSQVK